MSGYIPPTARPGETGARCETPAGGPGQAGPGRAGLVNWQIERLTWRRGPSSHPARPPRREPPAAGRGLLPGRPAPATNWPTRPPLRQPGGARPALPAGPGRRAPTPTAGGPLRRAAGACRRRGRGRQRSALAVVGPPAWPAPVTPGCAARPHTVRPAPPATAVDPSAADRRPGWSASLHTLRPRLGQGEVCSPSLAQKVLGGRRVGHTKVGTPCLSRSSNRDGDATLSAGARRPGALRAPAPAAGRPLHSPSHPPSPSSKLVGVTGHSRNY